MFTTSVRNILARDYGIRDIPHDLLVWFVESRRAALIATVEPEIAVAQRIAADWQRGLTAPAT